MSSLCVVGLVRALVLVTAVTVVAAACGGQSDDPLSTNTAPAATDSEPTASDETPDETPDDDVSNSTADSAASDDASQAPAEISDDVPDVEMINVSTGETVNFRSVIKGDLPVLLWFWAPH